MGPKLTLGNEPQGLTINRVQSTAINFSVVDNRQSLMEA